MSAKKTHEEFAKKFTEMHPDYVLLSSYKGSFIKIKIKSLKCGHEWDIIPSNVLKNNWKGICPVCKNKKGINFKTTPPIEEVIEVIETKYPNRFKYIKGYTKMSKKCVWKCKLCNHMWEISPASLKHRGTCPGCKKIKMHDTFAVPLQKFLIMLKEAHNDLIKYVEGYHTMKIKCKFRCVNCKHEWWAIPTNVIYNKTSCAICVMKSMEKPVINFLIKNKIHFEHNKALEGSNFNGSRMPLFIDFFFTTETGILVVETDGRQHFLLMHGENNLRKIQARDKHKNEYCKKKGYVLIRVTSSPTKEWGTEKHITLSEFFQLIKTSINKYGNINLDIFRPYDFNRE